MYVVTRYRFGILAFILFLVLYFFVVWGNTKENMWDSFVLKPNKENFKICQEQVNASLSGKHVDFTSPVYIQLLENNRIWKILDLAEKNNFYAINLCCQFYPLFNKNAEINEAINISLGKVIKKDPELFLKLFKKYFYNAAKQNPSFISGLLGNYGPGYVDAFDKQLKETQERIEALRTVNKEEYKEVRDYCLDVLKKSYNSIENLKQKGI